MYIVTNRQMNMNKKQLDVFGSTPNHKGPNELRLARIDADNGEYKVELLSDKLTRKRVQELKDKHGLSIEPSTEWYMSFEVACELFERARQENKHLLFFVHGYNNDVADVVETAEALENLYNVIVVPFSWPANGGGKLSGTAAYLDDKQDARVSAMALNSFVKKIAAYHQMLTEPKRQHLLNEAQNRFPDNPEKARQYYMRCIDDACSVKLGLLCHSMGNYLMKYSLIPSSSALSGLVFDNICLVAADANNEDHETWLQRVPVRNRLYVVINENDGALMWSRRKPGKEQKERLGHYLRNLKARNANYIDVSDAAGVGSDHSYFKGEPVARNSALKALFKLLFEGGIAEKTLPYRADLNVYRVGP